jgi:hypothetical protein
MTAAPPDVSVIIVSWNTRALTMACLESLPAAARTTTWDAWVVDNASTDDSVAAIRAAAPHVRLIANADNVGFAVANNQGIAASRGRYVLLLNSDTVMAAGSLDVLVALADARPRCGVGGPMLLNPDGTYQTGPTPFPTLWNEVLAVTGLGRRLTYRGFPSRSAARAATVQRADYVGGACMLARREAIAEVGGLDEGYFMYSEEPDWCWRMRAAGWEVWYTPDARITHFGGQSTGQVRDAMLIALYRSKVRFFRQHRSRWQAAGLTAVILGLWPARRLLRKVQGKPPGPPLRARDLWNMPLPSDRTA